MRLETIKEKNTNWQTVKRYRLNLDVILEQESAVEEIFSSMEGLSFVRSKLPRIKSWKFKSLWVKNNWKIIPRGEVESIVITCDGNVELIYSLKEDL